MYVIQQPSCGYCVSQPENASFLNCKCKEDCGVGFCPASAIDDVREASHP